ncbi:restriction endonuclease subunit S [Chlorogloea sp. CCALA 695]|uniref:restriction endonuclease subunit S n=1 Tax=Chlorogloea sp. CCALA 695 TaxID=2107693 RepID=UPI000D049D45|nr:restriction endonuclease subunit S [Chlorogloea sp. CCALA 695]PSB32848.1 restriction endonuclease subunit S [Chlorogloea sp. CCALA 695]
MVNFPKYESYKDSGVEWLSEVPSHWELMPLKRLFSVSSGDFLTPQNQANNGYSVYGGNGLRGFANTFNNSGRMLLIGRVGAKCGNIHLVNGNYWVSEHALRVIPKKIFCLDYFKYLLEAIDFNRFAIRTAQPLINSDIVLTQKVAVPSTEEQKRVAKFLDRKTSEIDQAIAQKQRLIELLQEQKAILINQAVTKGLNPNVPMCDRGIEWLGEIPAHWKICKAKYLFEEVNERSKTGLEELLSVSHMTGVTPRSEKNVYMFMAEDYSGSKLCRKDDLVINIMWAWMGALGVSAQTGIVSPSYGVFRQLTPNTFNSWYLEHLLRSTEYVAEYNRRSTGLHSSRLRLYAHMFLSLEIAFPSKEEQDRIEAITIDRTVEIDTVINTVKREIKALEEFCSIIISQAVTGKIKV